MKLIAREGKEERMSIVQCKICHRMKKRIYRICLSHLPEGARIEQYLCSPTDFRNWRKARTVAREFYAAKTARPEDFPAEMEAEVIEV